MYIQITNSLLQFTVSYLQFRYGKINHTTFVHNRRRLKLGVAHSATFVMTDTRQILVSGSIEVK